jgi:nucleotide-binding universal stress UspA family protein
MACALLWSTTRDIMNRIRRILCPIDFSEPSRRALDHAAAIARRYKASLSVLYVFPNMPVMDPPPRHLGAAGRAEIMADLRQFILSVPGSEHVSAHVIEAADVHREIDIQARALGADLLVMGSHGRSGFKRLLLGSVTENTLRITRCPVLVVPPAAEGATQTRWWLGRILCAIDFSQESAAALGYGLSLAQESGGELTLIHAIEVPPELRDGHVADLTDVDRIRAAEEARCLRKLRDLVPERARLLCTVSTLVDEGAADHVILAAATAHDVDLIVMGVRGHGALDLAVFGSTARQVIRAARCPVLVVHARAAAVLTAPVTETLRPAVGE